MWFDHYLKPLSYIVVDVMSVAHENGLSSDFIYGSFLTVRVEGQHASENHNVGTNRYKSRTQGICTCT